MKLMKFPKIHVWTPRCTNADLAPLPPNKRTWGALRDFNVWSNDIRVCSGLHPAATLFISYNGLTVWPCWPASYCRLYRHRGMVQLTRKPSEKYGIPSCHGAPPAWVCARIFRPWYAA